MQVDELPDSEWRRKHRATFSTKYIGCLALVYHKRIYYTKTSSKKSQDLCQKSEIHITDANRIHDVRFACAHRSDDARFCQFAWKRLGKRETCVWRVNLLTWLKLSAETSPLLSSAMCSGLSCVKRSQIDSPFPWLFHPPSIWYADEPTPHKKSAGNFLASVSHSLKSIEKINLKLWVWAKTREFHIDLLSVNNSGNHNITIFSMRKYSKNKTIIVCIALRLFSFHLNDWTCDNREWVL